MQKHLRMWVTAFSLLIATSARADQITSLQLYYTANVWQATHDQTNTLYQDLVSAPVGGVITVTAVPEPSSFVIASVSVLFFVVIHWWRGIV
jgi:hypothetical protein